jgi:hypothetical protein
MDTAWHQPKALARRANTRPALALAGSTQLFSDPAA